MIVLRGESHLAMNLATGGVIATTGFLLMNLDIPEDFKNAITIVKDFLIDSGGVLAPIVFIPIAFVLYMLGGLLPDVDTPYSMLGRIICLPFEHRTWTHAIWFPLILMISGIWVRLLFWLGFGMLMHDVWDSFSASGIHWFYPIKRKKPKRFKLYHTGQPSEYVVGSVFFTITIVYAVVAFQIVFDIFGMIGSIFH